MPKADPPITDIPAEFTTTSARIQYMFGSAHEALARAAYDPESKDKVDPGWAVRGPVMAFFYNGIARYEEKAAGQKPQPPAPAPGG